MIYLALFLIALSGISEAIMDALDHGTTKFDNLNQSFWEPLISSNNKWKNGDKSQGEKFFGSSTFLVWTTDAWHLFKTLRNLFLWSCFAVSIVFNIEWWFVFMYISLNRAVFELTYRQLRK